MSESRPELKLRADLGCLQSEERLPGSYQSNVVTVRRTFACNKVEVDLPTEGMCYQETTCPVCGETLSLALKSPERLQWQFMGAALLISATLFGLGWLLSMAGQSDQPLRIASHFAFGLGGVGLLAVGVLAYLEPSYLVHTGDAMSLAFTSTGQHQLLNVRLAPQKQE